MIEKKPFVRYKLDKEKRQDAFTVALNEREEVGGITRERLEICKEILEQEKDSTAIKQLASLGANMLYEQKTKQLLQTIYANKRRNKRIGVNQFE
ncbi:MAG: hypothetical protein KJ896_02765 [Nanoarchaeota archaeon]|nr:hypothetical protein [Nanoarchaeota archaeon]